VPRYPRAMLRALVIAGAVLAVTSLLTTPASSQLLWDWGGGKVVGDSGREVVPFSTQFEPGQVIVSFSDRRLYFIRKPGVAVSYPIAVPREEDRWEGVTTVSDKKENPSWTPTQAMLAENPRLPSWVPGGHPMNPLGVRALYLGSSFYRIHGTDAPWTIGTAASKGCIRLYNKDMLDLYQRVEIDAVVVVTWQRFLSLSAPEQSARAPAAKQAADRKAAQNAQISTLGRKEPSPAPLALPLPYEQNARQQMWDCQIGPDGRTACHPITSTGRP
jgi:lipoprotein-anchoring transpeptidase ErfK/SrfK